MLLALGQDVSSPDGASSSETAVGKFEEAKATTPPNTDLIREGQDAMKAAHKALQEAQQILRKIVLSIKQKGGEEELEETEEEEAEEEEVEEEETEGGEAE